MLYELVAERGFLPGLGMKLLERVGGGHDDAVEVRKVDPAGADGEKVDRPAQELFHGILPIRFAGLGIGFV